MPIKKSFIHLIAFLAIGAIPFQSCNKSEVYDNEFPTCEISAPLSYHEVIKGESITISAEANDKDGNISKVSFMINGVEKASVCSCPYEYTWNTNDESIGSHIVKVTSHDDNRGRNSDEIIIKVVE